MHLKLFAAIGVTAFALLTPVRAEAGCCDQANHTMKMACCDKADVKMACCDAPETTMTCCDKEVDVLAMLDPQLNPAPPVRQFADVWFKRPTVVGRSILEGHYVIEHDTDRMARGEPCTHIYAYNDRTKPVVTFHCTHIERDERASHDTVRVIPLGNGWQELTEFQFAGEYASHGYPSVR